MGLSSTMMNARYRLDEPALLTGYVRVIDEVHHKEFLGRIFDKEQAIIDVLKLWTRQSHPVFRPVYRILEQDERLIAVMPVVDPAVSLEQVNVHRFRPQQLEAVLLSLIHAGLTLSRLGLRLPQLTLEKVFFDTTINEVFLMGHEAAVQQESGESWARPAYLPYAAPELLRSGTPTNKSDVYRLAMLLHEWLTGEVLKPGANFVGVTSRQRRLKKAWDHVLAGMLDGDSGQRWSWETCWQEASALFRVPDRLSRAFFQWHSREDHKLCERLLTILDRASDQPQAVALQSFPGREKMVRLQPFTEHAGERGYLVLHLWHAQALTRAYQTLNDLIELVKLGLAEPLNKVSMSAEWVPLSEWQSADEIEPKWQELVSTLGRFLVPNHYNGIVIILEDMEHVDHRSLEALGLLGKWLDDCPFMYIVTSAGFSHEHCRQFHEQWPYDWHHLEGMIPREQKHGLRDALDKTLQQQIDESWQASGGREHLFFYHLAECAGQTEGLSWFLDREWRVLHSREQLVLKVLAESARDLMVEEIEAMFGQRNLVGPMMALRRFGLVNELGMGRYGPAAPAIRTFIKTKLDDIDRPQILRRLYDFEMAQTNRDRLHLLALCHKLGMEEQAEEVLTDLLAQLVNQMDLEPLGRILNGYAPECETEARLLGVRLVLSGTAMRSGAGILPPGFPGLNRANKHFCAGRMEKACRAFSEVIGHRRIAPGVRGLAMVRLTEAAVASGDQLTVSKTWRAFSRRNWTTISSDTHGQWVARMAVAMMKVGKLQASVVKAVEQWVEHPGALAWYRAQGAWLRGDYQAALAQARQVPLAFEDHHDLIWRAEQWKFLGNCQYRNNHPADAIEAYHLAQALFAETQFEIGLHATEYNLAVVKCLAGRFAESVFHSKVILERARDQGDQGTECEILFNLMSCVLNQNRWSLFTDYFTDQQRLARRLRRPKERLKGLIVWLQGALTRPKEEVLERLNELESVAAKQSWEPLLEAELFFAKRIGAFALDRPSTVITAGMNGFTEWRHRFLNFLCGDTSVSFSKLVATLEVGYGSSYHPFMIVSAIQRGLVPQEYLDSRLLQALQRFVRTSNGDYDAVLARHFRGVHHQQPLSNQLWDETHRLLIDWQVDEERQDERFEELLAYLNRLWPFKVWGVLHHGRGGWSGSKGNSSQHHASLAEYLRFLGMKRLEEPLAVGRFFSATKAYGGALFLPMNRVGEKPGLFWFLSQEDHSDGQSRLQPVFRFVAKLMELAWPRNLAGLPISEPVEERPDQVPTFGMVGRSGSLLKVCRKILKLAPSNLNLFISGKSGTGKELAAKAIHQASPRAARAFRAINCSNYTDNLVEAELFGHARGAFTGATSDRAGLLEMVHGGTLLIDEVGDLSPRVQSSLLRVVQEGEFSRIGETRVRKVDIRFITATHKNLLMLVGQNQFREDLFYRLVDDVIKIPTLDQRFEDLPLLAGHFAKQYAGDRSVGFDKTFFRRLREHNWPGNIREFESYIRRVLAHFPKVELITETHCLPFIRTGQPQEEQHETLEDFLHAKKRQFIEQRLAHYGGNKSQAAASMGLSRQQLNHLVRQLGLTARLGELVESPNQTKAYCRADSHRPSLALPGTK